MKIQIQSKDQKTILKIDSVDLSCYVRGFSLTQVAGELPTLIVTIPIYRELDIDLPDGVVIVNREVDKDEKYNGVNRCVCCGEIIPEGDMVCPACAVKGCEFQ